jgi:hypothetical protein
MDNVEIFSPSLNVKNRVYREVFTEPVEVWVNDHLVFKSEVK